MRRSFLTIVAVSALAAATAALADTTQLETKRGQSVSSGPYLSWTGQCAPGFLEIVVDSRPSHGELTIEAEDGVINDVITGKFGKCKGRSIKGKSVIYHPDADFVGTDRFSVKVTYVTKETFVDQYEVRVK